MVEKVKCPTCGKEYAKSGIKTHITYCKGKDSNDIPNANAADTTHVKEPVISGSDKKFGELNLNTEYQQKKEIIEPKKNPEAKYQCGNCGYQSDTKHRHCPECGISWDN